MSYLVTWKKSLALIQKNKKNRKIITGFSVGVLLLIGAYFFSLHSSLMNLQHDKKENELKINVLGISAESNKERMNTYAEKVKELSAKVERMSHDSSIDSFDSAVQVVTSDAVNTDNNVNVTVVIPTTTPAPTTLSAQGGTAGEIYDPSRKTITLYRDASTISHEIGSVPVGSVVIVQQKNSDWIQIIFEDKAGWVQARNVRFVSR